MRKGFTSLLLMVLSVCIYGQSEPQFTQYMYNRYLYNPAYAGSEDAIDFSLLHRSQYVSLANRFIASQGFNFNLPVYSISSGAGITAINDLIGYQRATYVALNYDYRRKFKWGKLGIGLGAGIVQTSLDGSKLRAPDGSYEGGINHNDTYLPVTLQQGLAPDLSFGVYLNSDRYFAGVSINHIAFSIAKYKTNTGTTSFEFSRNFFVAGGYDFKLSNRLKLMPAVKVKTDFKEVQTDLSATFTIIDNILTGISFRGYNKNTIDALALVLGFRYKGIQLVYSYDASLSYLTKFNTGSHEVSFNYKYPLKKKENRGYFYNNPRFNL